MQLRVYQHDLILQARAEMKKGAHSVLMQSPTGSGKTALTAQMLKNASEKGNRSWFLVHRRELVRQSVKAFTKGGVHHGIISADFPEDARAPVQIGSIQTITRRLERMQPPTFVVYDECHHLAAGSWEKIYRYFPKSFHVGLTATPCRTDGKGLKKFFESMVNGPSVRWLIDNHYLAEYKLFAPASGVQVGGDFSEENIFKAVTKPLITGNVVREYLKHTPGKRAIVFAVSIEHSKQLVAEFIRNGVRAMHVDGETPPDIRDMALEKFEAGSVKVLVNVSLFGEGLDIPGIEVMIDVAPTESLSIWLQRCGRALRPALGKRYAYIIDHAQNVMRHGLPCAERKWTLDGDTDFRGKKESNAVKVCPQCFAAQPARNSKCEACALVFILRPREVDRVDGELIEIDPAKLRAQAKSEQGMAKNEEELIAIGIARNYARPRLWARAVILGREKKRKGST